MYMMSIMCVFFFKQKTAYEMRISDWSSDVCSSDLQDRQRREHDLAGRRGNVRRCGGRPGLRAEDRAAQHQQQSERELDRRDREIAQVVVVEDPLEQVAQVLGHEFAQYLRDPQVAGFVDRKSVV